MRVELKVARNRVYVGAATSHRAACSPLGKGAQSTQTSKCGEVTVAVGLLPLRTAGCMDRTPPRSDVGVRRCELRRKGTRVARTHEWIGCVVLALALFGLLGGWEAMRGGTAASDEPVWLTFPISLAYWLPLLIPFTTYVVIARWTGVTMFRYS